MGCGGREELEQPWDGKSWMTDCWNAICERSITDIVLPGSHDSGTARLTREIANDDGGEKIRKLRRIFGTPITNSIAAKWSQCQPLTIAQQLELGVRYLDLRIGRDETKDLPHALRCCHGFFGEGLVGVFEQVRDFCAGVDCEFVVIDLCHLYLSLPSVGIEEAGGEEVGGEEDEAHRCLVDQLEGTLGHLLVPAKDWRRPISQLRANGRRVFVFYPHSNRRSIQSPSWSRDWQIEHKFVDSPWPQVPEVFAVVVAIIIIQ
jgi:hypothetical protein